MKNGRKLRECKRSSWPVPDMMVLSLKVALGHCTQINETYFLPWWLQNAELAAHLYTDLVYRGKQSPPDDIYSLFNKKIIPFFSQDVFFQN